jgi:hypothetical protein
MFVDVKVNGIPAQALVLRAFVKKPDPTCWESDLDCTGYSEMEFELYDRKGYRAEWLDAIAEREGLWDDIESQIWEFSE